MSTTVRQIPRYVQKIAKKAGLHLGETRLVKDRILGICQSGSCKVSDIVRALNGRGPFRGETRAVYDGLSRKHSGIDRLRNCWIELVAPTANQMPFIAVDPSDIIKPYGRDFACNRRV